MTEIKKKRKADKTDDEDTNPEGKRPDFVNAADFGAGMHKSSKENIEAIHAAVAAIPNGGTVFVPDLVTVAGTACIVCGSAVVFGVPCPVDGYTN